MIKIDNRQIEKTAKRAVLNVPAVKECWKAKQAAEQGENVSEKVKCPLLAIYNHKGVCTGCRRQRRNLKCYK